MIFASALFDLPFIPETLQTVQPQQPGKVGGWFSSEAENVSCTIQSVISRQLLLLWLWNLVHAPIATWTCYNIFKFQVKYHRFCRSHQRYLDQNHCPSRPKKKTHLKLLSLCSAFVSTWCLWKRTKNTLNPSLWDKQYRRSYRQAVSF